MEIDHLRYIITGYYSISIYHPFQLPREFHTDLMSPSIFSALKQPTASYGTPVEINLKPHFHFTVWMSTVCQQPSCPVCIMYSNHCNVAVVLFDLGAGSNAHRFSSIIPRRRADGIFRAHILWARSRRLASPYTLTRHGYALEWKWWVTIASPPSMKFSRMLPKRREACVFL